MKIIRCSLREKVVRAARHGLEAIGLEIRRATPRPALFLEYDPLRAYELANRKVPSRFAAPLDSCVSYSGFGYGATSWHPFTVAIQSFLAAQEEPEACRSALRRYYSSWTPGNCAEALICESLEKESSLRKSAPHAISLPWSRMSLEDARIAYERIAEYEHQAFDAPELSLTRDGYGLQGPVSERKLDFEVRRLLSLLHSVRCFGFDLHRDSPTVEVVMWGKEFRCVVKHGFHRLAVLAALGVTHVAVSIDQLLFQPELEHWSRVVRGEWSRRDAAAYCDHLFKFDSRAWARKVGLTSPHEDDDSRD